MSSIVPRKRLLRFRAFVRHSILVAKSQNVRGTFTFTTFNESAHSSARMDDDKIEANSGHIRGASEVHGHARLSMQDDSYIQDAIPKNSLNSTRKINKLDIEYVSKEVVEWRDLARLLPEEPITEEELHYIRLQHHSASERVKNILELWRNKCHGSATLGSLVESLHLLGYSELAMMLQP